MKKIIIPAISLAALLLTGACSIDERTSGDNGNEAMLTLNMGLDGAVQTRAIGDGSGADHLIYAVFDETGTRIEGLDQVSKDVTFPTTETITLAKGQTYKIAFWAQNKACTAYEVSDKMVVTIDYEGATSNDETRDAFFKTVEVTVTGDAELDVELTRPFAQLNVGIYESDWTAGEAAGIVISTSRAVVKEAASTLNLLDGTVADPVDVTFDFATIPTENLSVDLDGDGTPETYKYLSMNYILPNDGTTTGDASTTLSDLEFTFSPETGNDITLTQGLDAVPVQRNWRTNIIGQILSGDLSLNISIDPGFNGDNNHEIWDGSAEEPDTDPDDANTYLITTPAELAWVAEQVNSRTEYFEGKTILLMNDIDLSGSYWTPVGNVTAYPTVTFKGTFDGQNHTISNLTASDDAAGHAAAGLFGSILGTVKNVKLKDVNIRSTHYAGAVVGYSSMNGAIIENCHVDGGTIKSVPENTGSAYDNGDKAGGIIGYYVTDDKITKCTAKNLTITAYRDLGGITGCGPQSGMTGCSVENITLVQDNTNGYETEAVTTVGALGGRDVTNEDQPYDGEFASAVTKKVVGNISNAAQLASALTYDASEISVTLVEDIDLPIASLGQQTGGSGEYKLGGENTESILIDLNDHTLNLTTSYMSKLGAKNDEAVFTIQNGTMTSSTTDGTWDSYDLTFANCNYKIEDVVFEKSIAFTNDKRTVTMNGVTINEQNGDFYAMWISAVGQNITIDGLTLTTSTGRGIKIDEEYVNSPAKVTLDISNSKFTTVSKAAIMVDSKEGAEINVTNVDIANVAADPVFTVWIDEDAKDYAGKVIVNGAKVRIEGSNEQIVATSNDELAAADIANNATIYLTKGEYVIPDAAKRKTVTFIGTGNPEDVIVKVVPPTGSYENCDYGLDGSNATFEGITITTNSSTYIGYARCNGTYKNCIINGTYTLYGESTFENCVFNVKGDVYNIWTWGAEEIEFTGCTFNSDGKALLLYREDGGTVNLTVTGCTFNDEGGLVDAMKAAIEIGDSPFEDKPTYNVTVSNTTVNGYATNDKGISTGTNIWGNKNSMPKDRLNVTINGDDVY